jgi:hypothetical protein
MGIELVSGYFFMAGWLLIEKMGALYGANDQNSCFLKIVENQMIRKGKLPEDYNGKWSSLLIADRFFSKDFFVFVKQLSDNALNGKNELTQMDTGRQRNWTSCCTFNDDVVKYLIPRLFGIIDRVKKEFPVKDYIPGDMDKTFVDFGGYFNGQRNASQLEECVSCLAKWVEEWRMNPSLESAQPLRNILLEIQDIDDQIARMLPDTQDDDGKIWRPKYSILERIAFKADYFRSI